MEKYRDTACYFSLVDLRGLLSKLWHLSCEKNKKNLVQCQWGCGETEQAKEPSEYKGLEAGKQR